MLDRQVVARYSQLRRAHYAVRNLSPSPSGDPSCCSDGRRFSRLLASMLASHLTERRQFQRTVIGVAVGLFASCSALAAPVAAT